tara:strand:+ start:72 stop:548 length:477 start_codon:yes stop_codon:yes gene_type:complete
MPRTKKVLHVRKKFFVRAFFVHAFFYVQNFFCTGPGNKKTEGRGSRGQQQHHSKKWESQGRPRGFAPQLKTDISRGRPKSPQLIAVEAGLYVLKNRWILTILKVKFSENQSLVDQKSFGRSKKSIKKVDQNFFDRPKFDTVDRIMFKWMGHYILAKVS